ncbi:AAA family ATPase [Rhodococcus globerulus]|uniref:AAA family ATPase n=1 Tax=Rhodococcus globerulus TaxID=33008 RepID=UPI001586A011|nr:AAA family ATPase [Rhodococcus globerulus]
MNTQPLRLIGANITKVLGAYDHRLTFNVDDDFVIIYGPNGVGKTKFLEIIHAVTRLDARTLSKLPFETAQLDYSDGSTMLATIAHLHDDNLLPEKPQVNFKLRRSPRKRAITWTFRGDDLERWLVENTTWRPSEGEIWEDRADGEIINFSELESRYRGSSPHRNTLPPELEDFKIQTASYLIETQRLRIENDRSSSIARRRARLAYGGQNLTSSKITEHAAKMRKLVNEAQTEHSRITQQLDRTFPNRVLENAPSDDSIDSEIRNRYNDQNEFRSRLGRVASVALEDALSLPDRPLASWELHLLSLYLDDADKKLAPFETLLQKIELLEEIINSRLLNKRLQVTADEGLTVSGTIQERFIDLDSLSSGEQHEIILMFDLLFNVPMGALVMIDEPEISLHVVWQLAFIPDVQRIAELSGFRFVVATHSPQIINDGWDRAVRLGPETAAFS